MKLNELEPQFLKVVVRKATMEDSIVDDGKEHIFFEFVESFALAHGIRFNNPKYKIQHPENPPSWSPVYIFFAGRVDEVQGICRDTEGNEVRWRASGTGFDDLTLDPSIWVDKPKGWHGFVKNGEITNA